MDWSALSRFKVQSAVSRHIYVIPKNEFFSGDLDQNDGSVFCINEFEDANQNAHLSS